jgi:hypothetical protein
MKGEVTFLRNEFINDKYELHILLMTFMNYISLGMFKEACLLVFLFFYTEELMQ